LSALETADRQEPLDFMEAKIQQLQKKVALLKQYIVKLEAIKTESPQIAQTSKYPSLIRMLVPQYEG
jgi:hypothetical protein